MLISEIIVSRLLASYSALLPLLFCDFFHKSEKLSGSLMKSKTAWWTSKLTVLKWQEEYILKGTCQGYSGKGKFNRAEE